MGCLESKPTRVVLQQDTLSPSSSEDEDELQYAIKIYLEHQKASKLLVNSNILEHTNQYQVPLTSQIKNAFTEEQLTVLSATLVQKPPCSVELNALPDIKNYIVSNKTLITALSIKEITEKLNIVLELHSVISRELNFGYSKTWNCKFQFEEKVLEFDITFWEVKRAWDVKGTLLLEFRLISKNFSDEFSELFTKIVATLPEAQFKGHLSRPVRYAH